MAEDSTSAAMRGPGDGSVGQEIERGHPEGLRETLDRSEGRVALPTFEATDVGAMNADKISERFLRQTPLTADLSEVVAERLL
jgi:hypothetical protein